MVEENYGLLGEETTTVGFAARPEVRDLSADSVRSRWRSKAVPIAVIIRISN